ncbi:hypothetical protein M8818_007119 [Zalaria obscura]|uniref:Uncharacterized protein n=1 Tax=Zalaria obscura TaxID=2024903 RepID=A0ACC3S430_9PEZI
MAKSFGEAAQRSCKESLPVCLGFICACLRRKLLDLPNYRLVCLYRWVRRSSDNVGGAVHETQHLPVLRLLEFREWLSNPTGSFNTSARHSIALDLGRRVPVLSQTGVDSFIDESSFASMYNSTLVVPSHLTTRCDTPCSCSRLFTACFTDYAYIDTREDVFETSCL